MRLHKARDGKRAGIRGHDVGRADEQLRRRVGLHLGPQLLVTAVGRGRAACGSLAAVSTPPRRRAVGVLAALVRRWAVEHLVPHPALAQ